MSAQPKKKISKVRGKTRRAHWRATLPRLVLCAKCKVLKLPHRACPECGYYGRAKVLSTKLESKVHKTLEKTKPDKPSVPKKATQPKTTHKTINTPKNTGEEFHTDQE
ncbi:TPA: 50S ribosomal protein L32 [Patescibacteria group bacterium]|uniref:Large ribosomal subunit protein bL32 n=2 Tax=Bacteria division Kazan-3B-28 TaxID=1798534 RepID=A0A0G2A3P4_UNCK3|nr:MAG: 50S ribosomal protein L32, large subunit ribosomal protein L32 [candidate division Kazan bacterium GW2011_GWA1_50_15]KKW25523.1 MAG: 50S ribosomal protein L32 [candidate division Kazan bacterium GW2011_GWC1_52_13]KKW26829.1 MAG: 50S ribosomal protein L32 [candidate division Kazan bacterium GW2011_GWB1_52_7]HAV65822.1 50S ribosomal protein L32 [Patescibacteria group bacterium]HCL47694.1 50S ribosomal protein L32 [Patescibacteria group bacterium]